MSMPKILCTVRALHSFHSPEQSSLSFDKGDFIDVLSQLESGWWDGWCKGSRGWFPSNYVEMVNINPEVADQVLPTARKYSGRSNSNDVQRRVSDALPRNFSESSSQLANIEETPDSDIGDYLYDPVTGSVQYRPRDESTADPPDGIILRNGSIDGSDSEDNARLKNSQQQLHIKAENDNENEEHNAEYIMSKWVERVTPQGRVYFCNLITQETTWSRDDIDPFTGHLKTATNGECHSDEDNDEEAESIREKSFRNESSIIMTGSHSVSTATTDRGEPLTWQSLSGDVALAIHQLNTTAQQNLREFFVEHTSIVTETIRVMLYAAGLMDKDSHHTPDPELRQPHRNLMAALSKLVLSARIASELPLTPFAPNNVANDTVVKLQKDAGDVLAAVRNFVTACQQRHVRVEQIMPRLMTDKKRNRAAEQQSSENADASSTIGDGLSAAGDEESTKGAITTAQQQPSTTKGSKHRRLNQDLLTNLQSHVNQIYGSISALASDTAQAVELQHEQNLAGNNNHDSLQHEHIRISIVEHFRTIAEQVSQCLVILEDINFDDVDTTQVPAMLRFRVAKQGLYDTFGHLFGAIQALSNLSVSLSGGVSRIDDAVLHMEDSLEQVLHCVQQMVGQRRLWLSRRGTSDTKDSLTLGTDASQPTTPLPGDPSSDPADDESDTLDDAHSGLLSPTRTARRRQPGTMRITSNSTANTCASPSFRPRQLSTKTDISIESLPFLGHDHPADQVVFTSDGGIKGGTLSALVERLTLHDTLDTSFIANFLLTYRSFCTTEEFVNLLEKRYTLVAPEGLTPQELEIWTKHKQKLIRLRVFNVMKNWLESYYIDEDEFILDQLEFFTTTVIRDASSFSADQLMGLINKRRELDADDQLKKLVPNNMAGPPPIVPKNVTSTSISLLDTDPLELARQLSLLDFKLYSSIRPIECLNKAWSRDDTDLAVHVKQSIDYCNRLTAWVTGSILEHEEAKRRVVVIKHWAQVADRCRMLNNYNTCMAIFSAFDNSAVGRLRRTWELVGNRTSQTLSQIRKLMGANRNFTEYREMIHSVNPPCIPFLGIYLQDLTFIEDGNPDFLAKSNNLINFAKRQKTAEVIREIKQFQSSPYTLQEVPLIQHFIKTQLETTLDVETLYERSLVLEPRTTAAAAEAARLLEMIN
ncbi:cell division control protein [Lichtheimia corymbifera JMRC:FSU:9682]|uniref:Cell division control protein n=1 Tax=Lichtheimia corymbifera JMRC:FSU:9682 TaxID=1263082 RepID=A0A068RVJ5_9FUNG|nr:cell division control protein [Lichtheimia corymbifera JMRC:FSU:9682]